MGGLAGFVATYLIGPREGLYRWNKRLSYLLEEDIFDEYESSNKFNRNDKLQGIFGYKPG